MNKILLKLGSIETPSQSIGKGFHQQVIFENAKLVFIVIPSKFVEVKSWKFQTLEISN